MNWETATKFAYEIGKSRLAVKRIEFFRRAADYAQIRVAWQLATPEERTAMNGKRTETHDAFIEACDMMGRSMESEGEDVSWRIELGNDRKEIGDFACYIHLVLGLVAR